LRREIEVVRSQLRRNGIEVLCGDARFVDPHRVAIESKTETVEVTADHFVIACGTRPAHSPDIPFDGRRIVDSDQLLRVPEMHRNVIVLGAGVIGLEYASMLSALGVDVTIIDSRPKLLDFVDDEMIDTLCYHMRKSDATFRLGEKVASVGIDDEDRVVARLESGKKVLSQALLYTAGRKTNSDILDLAAAGLGTDERGRIVVNEHFQTAVPHIYAAGDVIGFPSLASSSMEQGRLAACHIFGVPCNSAPHLYPYGIYTIPEISMVGKTEQQLTEEKIPYEVGVARFEELAKGQMIGDETGRLKLLFCPETRQLLGVHAIGDGVTELIHIGQAVMSFGGTIDYLRDTVFNYPTLAEAYKVAALDGLNKL
jgi:NAD(P) transhydrogenase